MRCRILSIRTGGYCIRGDLIKSPALAVRTAKQDESRYVPDRKKPHIRLLKLVLQCDENRDGGCQRCADRNVQCDYLLSPAIVDNSLRAARRLEAKVDSTEFRLLPVPSLTPNFYGLNGLSLPALNGTASMTSQKDIAFIFQALQHFHTVTYATMSSTLGENIMKQKIASMVTSFPYLLHATVGISAAHLQYLLPKHRHPLQYQENRLAETRHWHQALRLFRAELSKPEAFGPHTMDALLTTCMLSTVHTFELPSDGSFRSIVDDNGSPKQSVPGWISSPRGLLVLSSEFGQHMKSSVWLPIFTEAADYDRGPKQDEYDIPLVRELFNELCDITPSSTPVENPYFLPLEALIPLLSLRPSAENFPKLIPFPGMLGPPFCRLLKTKDSRALLILFYWLVSMSKLDFWWISPRARMECTAIANYLASDPDPGIQKLLGMSNSHYRSVP